jgi:hypothetical protein
MLETGYFNGHAWGGLTNTGLRMEALAGDTACRPVRAGRQARRFTIVRASEGIA